LQAAAARGELPAEIALVVSNEPEAPGLARARDLGIPALALPHGLEPGRAAHEAKVVTALREAGAEWMCLAGYMRRLSPAFVAAFPGRILNIHPNTLRSRLKKLGIRRSTHERQEHSAHEHS